MKWWTPMLWSMAPIVASLLNRWRHTGKCLVFWKCINCFFLEKYTHVAVIAYEYVRPELCGTRQGLITWPLPPMGWEFLGVANNEACSARFWQKYNQTEKKVEFSGSGEMGPTLRELFWVGEAGCASQAQACLLPPWHLLDLSCTPFSPHLSQDGHQRFHLPSFTAYRGSQD